MDAAVWGFIGVIVGSVLTLVGQWLNNRHESSLDSAKRRDDRRIERDRFERTALVDMQAAAQAALVALALATEENGTRRLDTLRQATVHVQHVEALGSQIVDDSARAAVTSFVRAGYGAIAASKPGRVSEVETAQLGDSLRTLIAATGPLIRSTLRERE